MAPRRLRRPAVPAPVQARTVVTRGRLVLAACALLARRGLASASTADVARAAGVSHGALFRHFPRKPDLLAAAVEANLAALVAGFDDELAGLPGDGDDVVGRACAALWRIFHRTEMRVVLEVFVAARTDPELAHRLAPVLGHHQAQIAARARALFPDVAARDPALDDVVLTLVYAMQGAVVGLFSPGSADGRVDLDDPQLAFLVRMARRELGGRRGRHPRSEP